MSRRVAHRYRVTDRKIVSGGVIVRGEYGGTRVEVIVEGRGVR